MTKSNHFSQSHFNSDQDCTRGKNVASTAITTTSTTVTVNTNIQPQVQAHLLSYQNTSDPSRKPVWPGERKRIQAEKLEDFIC